ncbi:MAG: 2'-5' RNA ligase family protein, partial [Alkalispirochaetaceae bacterium]
MKRLFIAGELDEGSAEQLESQIQRFRTTFAREAEAVRWVARERYHLTLVFLGDTEERQIPGVREIVRQCAFPGIPELRIGPPIVFPRPSSPRVLARSVGAGA